MSTPLPIFPNIIKGSEITSKYLNNVLTNLKLILSLGNLLDDNGNCIDWNSPTGNWLDISNSIKSIFTNMTLIYIGRFDETNVNKFKFLVNFFDNYNSQKSIQIASIDISKIIFDSGTCIFGNLNNSDQIKINHINDLISSIESILCIYESF
jgi:hypothetical protein